MVENISIESSTEVIRASILIFLLFGEDLLMDINVVFFPASNSWPRCLPQNTTSTNIYIMGGRTYFEDIAKKISLWRRREAGCRCIKMTLTSITDMILLTCCWMTQGQLDPTWLEVKIIHLNDKVQTYHAKTVNILKTAILTAGTAVHGFFWLSEAKFLSLLIWTLDLNLLVTTCDHKWDKWQWSII